MWPSVITLALYLLLSWAELLPGTMVMGTALATYLLLGGHVTLWQIYYTLPRDLRGLYRYLKLQYRIRRAKRLNQSVPKISRDIARENAEKVAFYFEDEKWTFKEVDEFSNRVGNYFSAQGISKGDSVALSMENRVEYVCLWLGLTKIGCVPALINFHLRQEPLKHCIRVAKRCKAIVVGAELQDELATVLDEDDLKALPVFVSGKRDAAIKIPGGIDADEGLKNASSQVPPQLEAVGFVDDMVYIYTSGTTGLPKAAVIKHSRGVLAVAAGVSMIGLDSNDIVYSPLPLYHLAAGILGSGMALVSGITVVLRKKFSASGYWPDCIKYNVTAAQYIGEICRYLYNLPPKPEDTQHNVRIMFGNGLRPTLWDDFQKRFAIPTISEFYGSTEGNANIINIDGRKGAVGFVSVLFPSVYPVALLKVDQDTGEILRGPDGLCIRCQPGEAGEFVGKIVRGDPVRDFHGYADETASKKKVVRDVFRKGDAAFLSGDILVMDEEGYLYFKDRTGDTYRWKGENVSTAEVESIVSGAVGNADVVVYGVEVPGAEGRAGMAAVERKDDQDLDLTALYAALESSLAAYARPLFIRWASALERTGTFKLKKVPLQKEGFNPKAVKDPIFFLDGKNRKFIPLTEQLYEDIVGGRVRV
nr:long-chain fatty acid transport protein 4-like [Penaeus vannamei]